MNMNTAPNIATDQVGPFKPASSAGRVRWGLIGAGHIAAEFADGVKGSETGTLLAIGSRSQAAAEAFGAEHGIPRCYGSYQALLDDAEVDAVYIATPHPMHAEWAIKAAEAGKHILCEKPIGMNWPEAAAMVDAARLHDVFLMEAFMYRCHPQTAKLVELLQSGAIGKVGLIEATFCYHSRGGPEHRAYAQELGGGGILDVGCYTVSMARLIAGVANGGSFAEPLDLKGHAFLGPTGADHYATASVKFPGDILARLTTGIGLQVPSVVKVFGSKGRLSIADPWIPSRWNLEPLKIELEVDGEAARTVEVPVTKDLYSYEADMVGHNIAARQAAFPGMSWDDTLGNMCMLDRWRAEVGLTYELEKPANVIHTIMRRPLRVSAKATMRYGRIAGIEKPVSRLVLGADSNFTMPDTAILFDAFFEAGGNAFDTSAAYGHAGNCEANLGQWIRNRAIREQVVVLEKGANYPNNHPRGLNEDVQTSLRRTGLDYFDIYMIHRDNTDIPIEEWVDVLNENLAKGYFHAYGFSNFTQARVEAAQAYAQRRGLPGFSAISNNFSLARMLSPVWELCVSSSDPDYREWFEASQTPLMPWSSQARGFFTDRASRENTSSEEFNRCWYSEDNFRRKDRANQLAREKGVEPTNIALAYVLCQPFPTFPLVGPKRHSEIRSTLQALEVELTPAELAWLDLRE